MSDIVNAEVVAQSQAVQVRDAGALDRPMSVSEVSKRLEFVKQVMGTVMTEGQDYGKIPGCGDKPGLFQPGAQKLALTFQLAPSVEKEVLRELGDGHREYEFTLAINAASGRVLAHGVGTCSTYEAKYRYRGGERKCPECGKPTIIKGKAEYGGGWICFAKKGGCGAKFDDKDQSIVGQNVGRSENPDPADSWNTVRKMAFKRALVHGMINATNTSELWSQDLEDLGDRHEEPETPTKPVQQSRPVQTAPAAQKPPESKPASTAKPSGAVQDKRPEWKAWMIRQLLPVKEAAMAYAIDKAIIMPNEGLEDWPLDQVVMSKETMAQLLAAIQGNPTDRNDPDHRNPPEPEMAVNDTRPKMEGVIRNVTLKEGKKKNGEPWSLWGIKLDTGNGEVWMNSFSNNVGNAASALKGQIAVIAYSEDEKGKTALEVRRPGEPEEDVKS